MSNHHNEGWGGFDRYESGMQGLASDYWENVLPTAADDIKSLRAQIDAANTDYIQDWGRYGNPTFGDGSYTHPSDPLDGWKMLPNWYLSESMLGAGIEFRDEDFSWGIAGGYFTGRLVDGEYKGDPRDPHMARNSWGNLPYIPGGPSVSQTDSYFTDSRYGPVYNPGEYEYGDSGTLYLWAEFRF
jgi:hypothetical protein